MENKHIYSCPTCGAEIYLDLYQLHLKHKGSRVRDPEISYIKELRTVKKKRKEKKEKHFCKQTSDLPMLQFST